MSSHRVYESPLATRYASPEISFVFSPEFKYTTWRRLWIALAKAEKMLGLPIADSQIQEMEKQLRHIDYKNAAEHEKQLRHDVMAHIHAFGDVCPTAKGVIHWGATSCFVTDNTDLIQAYEGLKILRGKLVHVIRNLSLFAKDHAALACLGYTHLQAAQPTTVGRRAGLWIQDLLLDLKDLDALLNDFPFLGAKGATGTQASFLFLFEGDQSKVKKLDELIAKEMGFSKLFSLSGQTYTRKQDMRIISILSGIAASAHKFATDMRLLAHMRELEEPFSSKQVGSSAMPHKRNPIHSERICGLARFLLSLGENPSYTFATQWLERSLDDSSNRRLAFPEAFLTADAVLNLLASVTSKIVVNPKIIQKNLNEELPFLATETILMEAVKKGGDRQKIHARLKEHAHQAALQIKEGGDASSLLQEISKDREIGLTQKEIANLCRIELFTGRAKEQIEEFLKDEVAPILKKHADLKPSLPPLEI
ncbi:MAG: adenylosuccinate lyase [Chlamydiales bacterium]|nr:adenylosuccinate lyase [Chlamydiales bacterium]